MVCKKKLRFRTPIKPTPSLSRKQQIRKVGKIQLAAGVFFFLALVILAFASEQAWIRGVLEHSDDGGADADSGYGNYRHQVRRRTANDNNSFVVNDEVRPSWGVVSQRDAELLHFWLNFLEAPEGSVRKQEAQKQLADIFAHRTHIDSSIELVGKLLFGMEKGPQVLNTVRPAGQPFVDDWDCLKSFVRTFEARCGSLSLYGMKYTGAIANICNAGIKEVQMEVASAQACPSFPSTYLSSLHMGFSA